MFLIVLIVLMILSLIVLAIDHKFGLPIAIGGTALVILIVGVAQLVTAGIIIGSTSASRSTVEREYQELVLFEEVAENSTNEELRFSFKERVDEFNENRERYVEGAKSFWWGYLYYPNIYEDTEYIEFELNTEEKEDFQIEFI